MKRNIFIGMFPLFVLLCFGMTTCKPAPPKEHEFKFFSTQLNSATFESVTQVSKSKLTADSTAFSKIKSYITQYYSGAVVTYTYSVEENIIDCHTFESQPSVRNATPESKRRMIALYESEQKKQDIKVAIQKDSYGREMICPEGSVPVRRLRLEDLTRFKSLEDFLTGMPHSNHKTKNLPADAPPHEYSVAGYAAPNGQFISSVGSGIGLWSPGIIAPVNESISQIWVERFNTPSGTQTVELGWIVYPQKFNTNQAVPFIFYTNNGYRPGGFCYNTDCPSFVLTSRVSNLGVAFPANRYSVPGNEQFVSFYAQHTNTPGWWVVIDHITLGYYPDTVFSPQGAPGYLSEGAQTISVGGETAVPQFGATVPQMGSSFQPPNPNSASQKAITLTVANEMVSPNLQAGQISKQNCYDLSINNNVDPLVGSQINYGGPGCGVPRK
ncbi:neprosin family prolyl endopeptidase [Leptospira yasudae]|uniref:DUF239 domain-containing protein n=1 Tax=Leptospira yasudae TaxID=2202201 RepID=A0A6N4QQC8_9LEPT|nr:neprosin family prolyl endopeptidase [Leptospira yasudae]TGL81430.1 DUF239 domain-containing protein [Leptospira yasudae]TGL81727.1 DUF239 domain-containing protein [Leptospira yasudae]TGL88103.1 DUF239 domain-containing protein [Leptospira yasudae]